MIYGGLPTLTVVTLVGSQVQGAPLLAKANTRKVMRSHIQAFVWGAGGVRIKEGRFRQFLSPLSLSLSPPLFLSISVCLPSLSHTISPHTFLSLKLLSSILQ